MYGYGMGSNLLSGLSLGKVIGGISKALGLVNQALPLYNQLKPIISNGKNILSIVNILNKPDSDNHKTAVSNNQSKNIIAKKETIKLNNSPTFFQ